MPLSTGKNLTLIPAAGSDWLHLFEDPDTWPNCRSQLGMIQISYQSLWNQKSMPWFGPNVWPNIEAEGVVEKCQSWNIDLSFFTGIWKPQYLQDPKIAIRDAKQCCDNLFSAGAFSVIADIDEGFYGAKQLGVMDLATQAGRIADFYKSLKTFYGDTFGLAITEPYPPPGLSLEEIIAALTQLQELEVFIEWFDIDINHRWIYHFNNPPALIRQRQFHEDMPKLAAWCKAANIPFGVIFWPGWDNQTTNQMYCENTLGFVDDWLALGMETPSRLVSECWVFSDEAHTQKLVPSNPPEDETFTHTWLIREIASRFGWGAV